LTLKEKENSLRIIKKRLSFEEVYFLFERLERLENNNRKAD